MSFRALRITPWVVCQTNISTGKYLALNCFPFWDVCLAYNTRGHQAKSPEPSNWG